MTTSSGKRAKTVDVKVVAYERAFKKIKRWVEKLQQAKDAVSMYRLNDADEVDRVGLKFTTMLADMRAAINAEWIEEHVITSSPTTATATATADGATATATTAADGATPITTSGGGSSSSSSSQSSKKSNNEEISRCTLAFPGNENGGRQRALRPEFVIHALPPLAPPDAAAIVQDEQGRDTEVRARRCKNCKSAIWNRGWSCAQYIGADSVSALGHHICCACFAQGYVCDVRHGMVLMQRWSVRDLMRQYTANIDAFNRFFMPQSPSDTVLAHVTLDPIHPRILDEFATRDPRPVHRSEVTVCYHLNLRCLNDYPALTCHQCKSRRAPYEIVSCTNPVHIAQVLDEPKEIVRARSGFYYCTRCIAVRYKQSPLDALSQRDWHCFVCRKQCECNACKPQFQLGARKRRRVIEGDYNEGDTSDSGEDTAANTAGTGRRGRRKRDDTSSAEPSSRSSSQNENAITIASAVVHTTTTTVPTTATATTTVVPAMASVVPVQPVSSTQPRSRIVSFTKSRGAQSLPPPQPQQPPPPPQPPQQQHQVQDAHVSGVMPPAPYPPFPQKPPPPQQQQPQQPIIMAGIEATTDVNLLNLSVGQMIYQLQRKCQLEQERNEKLAKEVESLRHLAIVPLLIHLISLSSLSLSLSLCVSSI